MGCLSRFALALLAALLLASPVAAHHVPVAPADTDAEAFTIAQAEAIAQDAAFTEAWEGYVAATSGPEQATAMNGLESLIVVTIEHLSGLDVRECYAAWHRALLALWETVSDAMTAIRTGVPLPPDRIGFGQALSGLMRDPAFAALFDCGPAPAVVEV